LAGAAKAFNCSALTGVKRVQAQHRLVQAAQTPYGAEQKQAGRRQPDLRVRSLRGLQQQV
jgi:hypothetical protein